MSGDRRSWEYQVVQERDDPDLDALGGAGWELVGVAERGDGPRLYFKRPALDFRERVTIDQKRRHYGLRGREVDDRGDLVGGRGDGA